MGGPIDQKSQINGSTFVVATVAVTVVALLTVALQSLETASP